MIRIRKELWATLEGRDDGWSDTLLWYARGVAELQKRALADRTSWRFLAAMHGIREERWREFGYILPDERFPDDGDRAVFWDQCQHSSWYFLPWHRGYLAAFERIVRDAVESLGGPADWALPYWNYNKPAALTDIRLPPCFQAATLPDGSDNPLSLTRRHGIDANGGFVRVGADDIDIAKALEDGDFEGVEEGIDAGFGGPSTGFNHLYGRNGLLEVKPHGLIHVRVGGQIPGTAPGTSIGGVMSSIKTAALDPVFWLHHANIDRLWEVWLQRRPDVHRNPTDTSWLAGPEPHERQFVMPDPDGQALRFVPRDMLDTRAAHLGYEYDDVSDPLGGRVRIDRRLFRLGMRTAELGRIATMESGMGKRRKAELMGANHAPLRLGAGSVASQLDVDQVSSLRFQKSFGQERLAGRAHPEPDRVFLNLENVRGRNEAAVFKVYVAVDTPGGTPAAEHFAGSFSMFGIDTQDASHALNGKDVVLEITELLDTAHVQSSHLDSLRVRIEPAYEVYGDDDITIGRISLYRQDS